MNHVIHITTVPQTAASFLRGQFRWLRTQGYRVTLISSPGPLLAQIAREDDLEVEAVPMARAPAPHHDLATLRQLVPLLRRLQPDIVHAHTPKAGLLGMLAATICRVPVRIYHLHGLRYETSHGWKRRVLHLAERTACRCAHRVLCVSRSLHDLAADQGLLRPDQGRILCHGSVNGIDISTFPNRPARREWRQATRARWGIPSNAVCLGFVGRLVRDKGILELAAAWELLRRHHPDLHLLLVGPFEEDDAVPSATRAALLTDPRVHYVGADWNPLPYFAAMDVVALPTYREGLGHVLLEAAAMELPVVASRVTGCVDVVRDGSTGRLVPPRDPQALADAVHTYVEDAALRLDHGQAARALVTQRFAPRPLQEALVDEYRKLQLQATSRLARVSRGVPLAT